MTLQQQQQQHKGNVIRSNFGPIDPSGGSVVAMAAMKRARREIVGTHSVSDRALEDIMSRLETMGLLVENAGVSRRTMRRDLEDFLQDPTQYGNAKT